MSAIEPYIQRMYELEDDLAARRIASFGDPLTTARTLGLPPPPPHYETHFDRPLAPDARRVIHAFVGSTKTTWAYTYIMRRLALEDPPPRCLYVTIDDNNARDFGARCRRTLEEQGLRGHHRSRWSDSYLTIPTAPSSQKEPTLRCQSTGSSLEGWRGDLVVLDDPFDIRVQLSAADRKRSNLWFYNTLLPRVQPGGIVVILLSPWHLDDFSMQVSKMLGWEHQLLPAESVEDGRRVAAWPAMWPLERLEQIRRKSIETAYRRRYLCDPSQAEGADFRREWLDDRKDGIVVWVDSIPSSHSARLTAWDFAISRAETADYTAGVTLAYDPDDLSILYVVDIIHRQTSEDHVGLMQGQWMLHEGRIVAEANQFQALISTEARRSGLPIEPITNVSDKRLRILALQPWFREGALRFYRVGIPPEALEAFWSEFKAFFTKDDHDDILDAMAMAVRGITRGSIGAAPQDVIDLILGAGDTLPKPGSARAAFDRQRRGGE